MDTLFLELLIHLGSQGQITEANMHQGGKFSNIVIDKDGETFDFTIMKKEGGENNG